MNIGFVSPWWLLLALAIPLVWFLPRPAKDRTHAVIRSVAILLIALAAARPLLWTSGGPEHHVVILDRTLSVDARDAALARDLVRDLAGRLPDGAAKSLVVVGGGTDRDLDRAFDATLSLASEGSSSLGDALGLAARRIPEGTQGSITLVSDGLATDSAWSRSIQDLSRRGIPVHVVPLRSRRDDTRILDLAALQPLRVGQVARLQVDVSGPPGEAQVELVGPAGVLTQSAIVLDGGRVSHRLEFEPRQAGWIDVVARIVRRDGPDAFPDSDVLERSLPVQDPLRVLYLGHRISEGGPRLGELLGPGFDLVPGPEDGRLTQSDLAGYDLAVLDDRPASLLPAESQTALVTAAREGGLGLFVSGGGDSFGAGGYHDMPLEDSLPVEFINKEEKKDPSTSLAIIIDTSGSMAGNRIRIAKEVTRLAIRRLLPHDKIGIVEFYGNKRWAAPLQTAANAIDIQRALNRLDAGGGTVLFPAVEEAFFGLKNMQTRYKHVLVLTDGGVESGDYETIMRRMARDGICVSTVLVGPGRHSEFLVQLAEWGNGRYYNAADRFNLPEILLKQPSTSRLPTYRHGTHEVEAMTGPGWWGSVDPRAVPPLAGYVETQIRPGAEVVLKTAKEGHPVLASWPIGAGNVTVLTTEPAGPGTDAWQRWDGYGPWMARVLGRTARDGRFPFQFVVRREGLQVRVEARRRVRAPIEPTARVITDDAETMPLPAPFDERAPGLFVATWTTSADLPLRLVGGTEGRPELGQVRLGLDPRSDHSHELQVDPGEAIPFDLVAGATAGAIVDLAAASDFVPATGTADRPIDVHSLAPWCLLLALLAYLADLLWRRTRRRLSPGIPTA